MSKVNNDAPGSSNNKNQPANQAANNQAVRPLTHPDPNIRQEEDIVGPLLLPSGAYYGVHTQRAMNLYPLCGEKRLADYPDIILAMLLVKKVAAITNMATGELNDQYGKAIVSTIDNLLEDTPLEQFPVHAFHGGGGISSNMNVNEVIANLANLYHFDQPLGTYSPIHPNDHVNLNHSTSDMLSTAFHIALIKRWHGLDASLELLEQAFEMQSQLLQSTPRLARTCLQDAVEINFGQFFSGYKSLLQRNQHRLSEAIDALYRVNLGGNIVGRQGDCSDAFFELCIVVLKRELHDPRYERSANLFDSSQNHDDMINIAQQLESLARGLIKIGQDLRLISSGPETGLCELELPTVQQGSSAMPGKVNPTIPEFLVQSCMQVIGRCATIYMTQDHGELDYNPWQNIIINNLLDAINCLENAMEVFTEHCVTGLKPRLEQNQKNIQTLNPTMVKLKQQKGYAFATSVYRETQGDIHKIRRFLSDDKE